MGGRGGYGGASEAGETSLMDCVVEYRIYQ
jgi:hypothetical protein